MRIGLLFGVGGWGGLRGGGGRRGANSLPGGPPFTGDTVDAMYVYASDLYVPYIDCVAPYKYCVALKSILFGPGKSRDHVSQ